MYSIVEFDDGIFAIPTIWLSADKTRCKWPPYDERKILKAVSKREEPNENWKFLSVIRVFGTAADYDTAIKKVSLAEQLTDISDSENARKTRKSRARIEYSDNSDSEGHPPKKRSKRIGSAGKKAIRSDIQYPEVPSVSSINRSPLINIKNDNSMLRKHNVDTSIEQEKNTSVKASDIRDTSTDIDHTHLTNNKKINYLIDNAILTKRNVDTSIEQEMNTSVKASDIRDTSTDIDRTHLTNNKKIDYLIDNAILTKRNVDTTIVREKNPRKACYTKETLIDIDHTFLTTNEKIDYLIELQKLSIKKENNILTKINDLKRFNDMDKSGHIDRNTVNDKNDDDNIAGLFPIEDAEQLKNFEEKLKNKEIYNQVVTKLYYRGGRNIDNIVNKIMSLIFTNSLACSYSYLGKQKKKSFNNLVLCKCVLDAIYRHKLDVKEDYIIKKIGFWLAQSPTRQAREKLKKENSESKTETKDTDVLVPSASESD